MLKSMTGFGAISSETNNYKVSIEIKSLNSKFLDANIRLPKEYLHKDIEVRNILTNRLERGKIGLIIELTEKGEAKAKANINNALVTKYFKELQDLAQTVGAAKEGLLQIALQMPGAIDSNNLNITDDSDWDGINNALLQALQKCEEFRKDEGNLLEKKFTAYIAKIGESLNQVIAQDPRRVQGIRERIKLAFKEFSNEDLIDKNRFEQELIYYIEKLDISEEKVRLQSHLDYFIESMKKEDASGKKLGFIGQEIGREINTIGSKANDAIIQRLVVEMKEELEKIKEQVLNIL
ncbi:MAG: YicC family protein [Cytophagales bacterium]|nr:MAG: YicC family protein [Cytophagales bacterium]